MRAPLISVIMPVYNAALFVREAIESVLAQTLGDFELIVIDDASTDRSREVLGGITDPRCRVLANATNLGAAETKNRGIEEARGEFLAFLDADDLAVPRRFARQVEWLRAHPDVGVLGANMEYIDTTGKSLATFDLAELDSRALRARLLFRNGIAQSSVMLRAAALSKSRFRREFEPAEDYDLWVRMDCGLAVLGETLVRYRVHEQSVSATKSAAMLRAVRAIHAAQLSGLGLDDSEDFHAAATAPGPIDSLDVLKGIAEWLCDLKRANQACEKYAPEIFDRELHARWLAVGGRAGGLGIAGWKAWRQSPLHETCLTTDLHLFVRACRRELARIIHPS